jgi:hypothetical protein
MFFFEREFASLIELTYKGIDYLIYLFLEHNLPTLPTTFIKQHTLFFSSMSQYMCKCVCKKKERFFFRLNCIYLRKSLWYRKLQQKFSSSFTHSCKYFMKNRKAYNKRTVFLSENINCLFSGFSLE